MNICIYTHKHTHTLTHAHTHTHTHTQDVMMTVKYECAAPLDVIVTEGAVATKMYIISKVCYTNTPVDTHPHTHTHTYI
jgi:hypothetical protein